MRGRPKLDPSTKKKAVTMKLPPWILEWLNAHPMSKPKLIERALIAFYRLQAPDEKKTTKSK